MKKNSSLVYSTETGRVKQARQVNNIASGDGIVRLQRETKGRKGKAVIIITGIPLPHDKLQEIAKKLKQHCGSGGSVKNSTIEIQGDHRGKIKQFLEQLNFTVKLAGG